MFSTLNDVTRLIYTRGFHYMCIYSSSYYHKYNRYESNKNFSNAQNIKHPWIKYSFRAHIIYQNLYLSIFLLMLNVTYYLLWIIVYFDDRGTCFLFWSHRLEKGTFIYFAYFGNFSPFQVNHHLLFEHFQHVHQRWKIQNFPMCCPSCKIALHDFKSALDHMILKHQVLRQLYNNKVKNLGIDLMMNL